MTIVNRTTYRCGSLYYLLEDCPASIVQLNVRPKQSTCFKIHRLLISLDMRILADMQCFSESEDNTISSATDDNILKYQWK